MTPCTLPIRHFPLPLYSRSIFLSLSTASLFSSPSLQQVYFPLPLYSRSIFLSVSTAGLFSYTVLSPSSSVLTIMCLDRQMQSSGIICDLQWLVGWLRIRTSVHYLPRLELLLVTAVSSSHFNHVFGLLRTYKHASLNLNSSSHNGDPLPLIQC